MKKLLTTTLALALTVTFTACGNSEEDRAKAAAAEMTCAAVKPDIEQDFEALANVNTKIEEILEKYEFETAEELYAAGENISDEEMYEAVEKECGLTKEQMENYESGMGLAPEVTPPGTGDVPEFEMPDELPGLDGDMPTAEEIEEFNEIINGGGADGETIE